MGFKSFSQLKTKQDKSKHRAVFVLLKQQPQPSREINSPKTTAGGEGGARRLGKARAYVLGRFLKSPFVYIPIIPGDKMLSAIKGMLPWLLHANKLLIRILWAQKEWKHLFKLILFSSCWQIFQLEDPIKYELLTGIKSLTMTPRNKQMGKQ